MNDGFGLTKEGLSRIFIFNATLVFSKSKNYTRNFSLDEEPKRSILKTSRKRDYGYNNVNGNA